jgi:hypothetical protein
LITRFDKLTTERDRNRVVARVKHETKGQFGATFPVALLQALNAGDDFDAWDASGAGAFTEHLIEMVQELTIAVAGTTETLYVGGDKLAADAEAAPLLLTDPVVEGHDPEAAPITPRRISPRRIDSADGRAHSSRAATSRPIFPLEDETVENAAQVAS